jgi:hypothetical protein
MDLDFSHLKMKDGLDEEVSHADNLAAKFKKRIPPINKLHMEIVHYASRIRQLEDSEAEDKSKLSSLWMEVVGLKDLYRSGTGTIHYHRPYEASSEEKEGLKKLFESLHGYAWSYTFGWIGQSRLSAVRPEIKPFESPAGIFDGIIAATIVHETETNDSNHEVTIDGHVKEIKFPSFGCNGELESLGSFPHLQTLIMDDNYLHGSIPADINHMTTVKSLSLAANAISGKIPAMSLHQLMKLDLSFNQLVGCIPDIFQDSLNLELIDLSGNQLSGSLPDSLGSLPRLKVLKAYSNMLDGLIPENFVKLTSLQHLDLSSNRLIGGIQHLCHSLALEYLNLSDNSFCEEVGEGLGDLIQLHTLQLADNYFTGMFHPAWCQLTKLVVLSLSRNNFYGILPDDFVKLSELLCCCLQGNRFIGPVPRGLTSLKKLKEFKLFAIYPSDCAYIPEAFNRAAFDRVYGFGVEAGVDNVHWDVVDPR